jgi:hypothetical protein
MLMLWMLHMKRLQLQHDTFDATALIVMCSAQVPFAPWQTHETVVCLNIRGNAVADVDGNTFPNGTVCSVADHRCLSTTAQHHCCVALHSMMSDTCVTNQLAN